MALGARGLGSGLGGLGGGSSFTLMPFFDQPSIGIMGQLMHGAINPITGLLSRLGVRNIGPIEIEAPPEPTSFGESLAQTVGLLIGWGTLGIPVGRLMTRLVARPLVGNVFGRVLGSQMARRTAELAIEGVGTGAILGGLQGFIEGEDVAEDALIGAGLGGAVPIGLHGLRVAARSPAAREIMAKIGDIRTPPMTIRSVEDYNSIREIIRGSSPQVIDDLHDQVMRRLARAKGGIPSFSTDSMSTLGKKARLVQLAKATLRDPSLEEAFKPVLRYSSRIRPLTGSLTKEQKILLGDAMGEAHKIKFTVQLDQKQTTLEFDLPKAPLKRQVRFIDRQIYKHRKGIDALLDKVGGDPAQLKDEAFRSFQEHTAALDAWSMLRHRIAPKIEEALGLAKRGEITTLAAQHWAKQAEANTIFAKLRKMPHPQLLGVLNKYGAASYDELTAAGKQEYDAIRNALFQQGVQNPDEVFSAYFLRPPGSFEGEKLELRKKLAEISEGKISPDLDVRTLTDPQIEGPLYNILTPTTYDQAMLTKPITLYGAFLDGVRHVLGEPHARVLRNARIQYDNFIGSFYRQIRDTFRPFMGRKHVQAREQIGLILEGKLDPSTVSKEMRDAAERLRRIYNDLFVEFGIDPNRFLTDYLSRIRERGSIRAAFGKVPEELKFFAEMERKGLLDPRETDALEIIYAYLHAGAKKKFYEPAFQSVGKAMKSIADPSRIEYFENLKQTMMGRPTTTERLVDAFITKIARLFTGQQKSKRYTQALSSFLAELQYTGALGFNLFSAIKNLTQQILPVAHLTGDPTDGIEYWFKARKFLMTKEGEQIAKHWNPVRTSRQYAESLNMQYSAISSILDKAGPVGRGLSTVHRKAAFWAFQYADHINVDTSFAMKFLYELDQGTPIQEAMESAYSFTMATQYMYGFDSPMLFKSSIGRQIGVLASWPLNWARLLWDQGVVERNPIKVVSTLALMAVGSEALSLTGFNFRSIHPVEVARGWLPWAMTAEDDRKPPLLRTVSDGMGYLMALAEGDPEATRLALNRFRRTASVWVPYQGSPVGRFIKTFLPAALNGWAVLDDEGRLKHQMARTGFFAELTNGAVPGEAVRSLIGPTLEGRIRHEIFSITQSQIGAYRRLRRQAITALLAGDYEEFVKWQMVLIDRFGTGIDSKDIEQELQLRSMTALDRKMMSLPAHIRAGIRRLDPTLGE